MNYFNLNQKSKILKKIKKNYKMLNECQCFRVIILFYNKKLIN
jgi:hypothetical protein